MASNTIWLVQTCRTQQTDSNDSQLFIMFFLLFYKQSCELCISRVQCLTQGDVQLWENNMENTSHN